MIVDARHLIRDASGDFACPACWESHQGTVRPPMATCPTCGVALEWPAEAIALHEQYTRPREAPADDVDAAGAMSAADFALAQEILDEQDPLALAVRVHRYYADMDRAERTPRRVLYLHLGYLAGALNRLATQETIRRIH